MILETYSVMELRKVDRDIPDHLVQRWYEHKKWFDTVLARWEDCAHRQAEYLYRNGKAYNRGNLICVSVVGPGGLEISCGWLVDENVDYYWSMVAFLIKEYGEDYIISADINNDRVIIS